MAFKQNPCTAH